MQLGTHPLFQRLSTFRNAKVFSKGKEVADDLRERWETSDSPFVHRIQVSASQTSILQPRLHVAVWVLLYSLLFRPSQRVYAGIMKVLCIYDRGGKVKLRREQIA